MEKSLAGKSVLVTGASAGIGKATVAALVGAGASVIATGRRQDALDALVSEHGKASVRALAGDLNDGGFVERLAKEAAGVDILVSNAGILTYAPILETSFEDTEAMFRTNVLGSFRITQAIAKSMAARGNGHIIMMTSIAARRTYALGVVYCMTKHALAAYSDGLRIELQSKGVRVSEIAPGMVETDIRATSTHPAVTQAVASRKFSALTPEEVADAVLYVAVQPENCCADLIEPRPRGAA